MKSTIWALPVDTSSVALIKRGVTSLVAPLLVLPTAPAHVFAQATQAAANDQGWPRECQSGSITFTVYQPQVESWKARALSGRAAVSVKDAISPEEQFGVILAVLQRVSRRC